MILTLKIRLKWVSANSHPLTSLVTAMFVGVVSACATKETRTLNEPSLSETTRKQERSSQSPDTKEASDNRGIQNPLAKPQATPNSTSAQLPMVTLFERSIAKRDCDAIRTLQNRIITSPESFSTSVALATAWCTLQKSPQDKDSLTRFLNASEQIIKYETPLFDASFIEQLKSEAYALTGDLSSSRDALTKAIQLSALNFTALISSQTTKSDLQIIEPLLNPTQLALLKELRTILASPEAQSTAIAKLDELLSQTSAAPVREKLLSVRLKLFSAFELSFASELTALEELRLKGDRTAFDETVKKVRRIFPARPFQIRLDQVAGTEPAQKNNSTEVATGVSANQCENLNPTAILNSSERFNLTPEKAIQLAKFSLNDGKPGEAVEILDSLNESSKNEKTRSLRREASEAHIKELRRKASEIYKKVSIVADPQAKLDSLLQCKQILENVLTRYPDTDTLTRKNIQKFMTSVVDDLAALKKVTKK
jgi:hypothetical protein